MTALEEKYHRLLELIDRIATGELQVCDNDSDALRVIHFTITEEVDDI